MDDTTTTGGNDALNMIDSLRAWVLRVCNTGANTRQEGRAPERLSDPQPNDESNEPSNEDTSLSLAPPEDGPVMSQLVAENTKLKDDLEVSNAHRLSLEEEIKARGEKLTELEAALRKSHTNVKRLNTIIFNRAVPNTGPPDDYFRTEFCTVRDTILRIVRSYYQATSVFLKHFPSDAPSLVRSQQFWLDEWSRLTPELRNYCVQGAIFEVLHTCFFSRPVFSTDSTFRSTLSDFELTMDDCPEISKADLVEWRRRTVTAAKVLSKNPTELIERAAKKIVERLEPALSQRWRQMPLQRQEQLLRDVRHLCEKTLHLAIDMRSSKATFEVLAPHWKADIATEDPNNEIVAIQGEEAPASASYKVLFTVFGGLEKTTMMPGDDHETLKLEKSQVVGYAG